MSRLSKAGLQELRKRTLADLRAHERAVADLRSVLVDLEAAERLLGRVGSDDPDRPLIRLDDFDALPFTTGNPFRQGSIRAVIWEVLSSSASTWLTTEEVRRAASKIMGRELALNSVGVSLSRMKPKVLRRGFQVGLASRAIDEMPMKR